MQSEKNSLIKNNTWIAVKAPHTNIIDYKWVFKIKMDADGNISCFKARLVARLHPSRESSTKSPIIDV